ncbi:MAG: RNA methyltransferase [Muribaculaceae bacterium]|nr:RNA methyltransferase [Muribaculaceae bacterium]
MREQFEMVAKTFQGLEDVLAEELRGLGAKNVEPGRRMVSFEGDLETLYKANLCCRTALRILKPIYKFTARNTDELYEHTKEFDWGSLMSVGSTFSIDTVAYSDEFTHSRFVTYRVKDAIVDWFKDRYGEDKRPGVRLQDADVMINVHISGERVTLSLDCAGESLHKRGYRVAQPEAPINEVLAAGIILKSGWRGDSPLVDPMCGSGTFLIEAALIAANINPGVYRRHFSFESWKDYDHELFDRLYNDDSAEREFEFKIYGADMSPHAVEIAARNIKSAGVGRMIDLQTKPLSAWTEAPEPAGVMVTNPPYGERISSEDMEGLYELIGNKLKNVFKGWHAWIIAAKNEFVSKIGLAPSVKVPILNGSIECELREYIIFEGDYKSFRREGGRLRELEEKKTERREERRQRRNAEGFERRQRDKYGRRDRRNGEESARQERPFRKDRPDRPRGGAPSRFRDGRGEERRFADKRRERRGDNARPPRNPLEERYRPGRPGAGKSFTARTPHNDTTPFRPAAPSENPLASRRSEEALRLITGKGPTLLPMRSRRKKDEDSNDSNN